MKFKYKDISIELDVEGILFGVSSLLLTINACGAMIVTTCPQTLGA